jgi:hypothetical protein
MWGRDGGVVDRLPHGRRDVATDQRGAEIFSADRCQLSDCVSPRHVEKCCDRQLTLEDVSVMEDSMRSGAGCHEKVLDWWDILGILRVTQGCSRHRE